MTTPTVTKSKPHVRKIVSGHGATAPDRRAALRAALVAAGSLSLAGCDRLSNSEGFVKVLKSAEGLSRGAQNLAAGRRAMAQEFTEADVAAHFKGNGTLNPSDDGYQELLQGGFKDWKLQVAGLVDAPASFSLADLRAMPSRTQITRHDCVEGWSTIGKWKGVQLSHVLGLVKPKASAKYVVFRCADSLDEPKPGEEEPDDALANNYYESVDLDDAYHPQTVLAYDLNDKPLPVANGAPLRARIERQLGYKHAKYLMRIELVESFKEIGAGNGGYWEDQGYEWYAGI